MKLEKIHPTKKLQIERQLSILSSTDSKTAIDSVKSSPKLIKNVHKSPTPSTKLSYLNGKTTTNKQQSTNNNKIMSPEHVETGNVSIRVYLRYIRAVGYGLCTTFFLIYIASGILGIASNLWLANWSDHAREIQHKNSSNYYETQKRLSIYTALGMGQGNFFKELF